MNFIKYCFVLLSMIGFLSCKINDSSLVQIITFDELEKTYKIDGIQLVDVRTADEYNKGHIKNALNIDFLDSNFELNTQKLDKNKPVIVYCQRGGRSSKSATKLLENAFVKVYNLKGGFSKWLSEGRSVEK
ncbi:MAG: rhodanese-like domain-containing protein [Flavobacteriaceae bacterium]|jgi:rhodanese-related sulfurtransferase|tara:strand:+ start:1014 stop:1406 length:393 start_codon:yes stop_codon:yes gene_type:complete